MNKCWALQPCWWHIEHPNQILGQRSADLGLDLKVNFSNFLYRGTDKSLARPGRKQATVIKLFASHSKTIQKVVRPSNQVSAAAMTPASDEKWRPFNCFFQSGGAKDLSAPLYYYTVSMNVGQNIGLCPYLPCEMWCLWLYLYFTHFPKFLNILHMTDFILCL